MSEFSKLKVKFINVTRRILERELSKNPGTLLTQETDLFQAYNEIIQLSSTYFEQISEKQKIECQTQLYAIRDKLKQCLLKLGLSVRIDTDAFTYVTKRDILQRSKYNEHYELFINPIETSEEPSGSNRSQDKLSEKELTDFESETSNTFDILEKSISDLNQSQHEHFSSFSETDTTTTTTTLTAKPTQITTQNRQSENTNNIIDLSENNNTEMPLTIIDLVNLVSNQIKRNYTGDPLGLQSFINNVELIELIINSQPNAAELNQQLPIIIKTRLEGKALETIPTGNPTVTEIKNTLKNFIKPDSSKVINGKMLALKANANNLSEYISQGELLAEALERALVIEGTSQGTARQMAKDSTIEMCRNNVRSEFMRTVMASSHFENPKDVLAKYIVESSKDKQEKQIMAYRTQNNNNRGRGNKRGYKRGYNSNRGYNNNRGGYNNNNNQSRTFYNQNDRGNKRGRGGRGYYNNNNQNVRVLENSNAPQIAYLGAPSRNHPQITEE